MNGQVYVRGDRVRLRSMGAARKSGLVIRRLPAVLQEVRGLRGRGRRGARARRSASNHAARHPTSARAGFCGGLPADGACRTMPTSTAATIRAASVQPTAPPPTTSGAAVRSLSCVLPFPPEPDGRHPRARVSRHRRERARRRRRVSKGRREAGRFARSVKSSCPAARSIRHSFSNCPGSATASI